MAFGNNTVTQRWHVAVNTTLKYYNDCRVSSVPPAFKDDAHNIIENHSPISFKPPGKKKRKENVIPVTALRIKKNQI